MAQQSKSLFLFIVAGVIALCVLLLVFLSTPKFPTGSHVVRLEGTGEHTKIFLADTEAGSLITLSDVYREHYHAAEFVNGDLYVIRRVTTSDGWTDQLWKYRSTSQGESLISAPGLDFRVNTSGNMVAVFTNSSDLTHSSVTILDTKGNTIRTLDRDQLHGIDASYALRPLTWNANDLLFAAQQGGGPGNHIQYRERNVYTVSTGVTLLRISPGHCVPGDIRIPRNK